MCLREGTEERKGGEGGARMEEGKAVCVRLKKKSTEVTFKNSVPITHGVSIEKNTVGKC